MDNDARTERPKVSIGSWAFSFGPYESHPWSFDRFADFAADAGYDGVEINGFRPHPHEDDYTAAEAEGLRIRLADKGLGISGFAPDLRSTPPAEVEEAVYLARIDRIADFVRAAEIRTVRVDTITPPTGPVSVDDSEARARLVTTWRASAQRLADAGAQLVWEFEPGFWINRPSDILRIVEEVDHANFGLLFDTSHAHTLGRYGRRQSPAPELLAGGAAEFASLVAPWVRHLHLIDSDGSLHDDDTSVHLPFGLGELDFQEVLDGLGPVAAGLEWWTADYCFWPETEVDALRGASELRAIRDTFLSRQQSIREHA
ncbi:sugar phosphate isomerase/epimerase family protein [Leifsonia sp. fls2-241-R2A-40a]|uniref:sugar phosphate isomerase/epimerase family protein n=1 Tax=Leifsonia sp. fls2-241-R2A-40a TaxID=3040290 RepID=UPI00254BD2B3|nr:sugar phosphate isomerase/epimerase family protein [Leifsonia sp. fls2-241-R2A-40a]